MFLKLKKWILYRFFGRKYYRTGKCNACGKCCSGIYVKHFRHVVQDEEEFRKLQLLHRFYAGLEIIGKDEIGLIFKCNYLDEDTHKCSIHKSRPGICRRYPQEELFALGGGLSENCGYKMEPIISFAEVFDSVAKKHKKRHVR